MPDGDRAALIVPLPDELALLRLRAGAMSLTSKQVRCRADLGLGPINRIHKARSRSSARWREETKIAKASNPIPANTKPPYASTRQPLPVRGVGACHSTESMPITGGNNWLRRTGERTVARWSLGTGRINAIRLTP